VAYESAAARGDSAATRVAARPSKYAEIDETILPVGVGQPSPYGSKRPILRLGNDDEIGYGMRRPDECFTAAVATVTQIPIEEIPDSHIDRRRAAGYDDEQIARDFENDFAEWLLARGLQMVFHKDVPVARERWIGVCSTGKERLGEDHCLVMSHGEILFDPARSLVPQPGTWLRIWTLSEVEYGITFNRKE